MFTGDVAYATLKAFRFVWLGGRTGGGKTALAFYLALKLLQDGLVDEIVSNIPSVGVFPSDRIEPVKKAIIIDEGGLYLKFSKDFEMVAAFLRKQQNYLILPSFIPPAREFSFFTIQRIANLRRILPLPFEAWLYRWNVEYRAQSSSGNFLWTNPQSVFGLYDTSAAPADDAGISEWIQGYVNEELKKSYGGLTRNREESEEIRVAGGTMFVGACDGAKIDAEQREDNALQERGRDMVPAAGTLGVQVSDAGAAFSDSADRIAAAAARISKALKR